MALNTTISNVAAIAACNAIVDLLDGAGSTIKIYTTAQPANPDVAIGAQVLLGTLTFATPAYGAAADAAPGGRATAGAITSDAAADATGTASWFRKATSAAVAHIDGECGTSGSDMNLNTLSIVSGAEIAISSDTVTMPES